MIQLVRRFAARRCLFSGGTGYQSMRLSTNRVAPTDSCVHIRSFHLMESLDLGQLQNTVFTDEDKILRKDRLIVGLGAASDLFPTNVPADLQPMAIAFRFGSIVFFNATNEQVSSVLHRVLENPTTPPASGTLAVKAIENLPFERYSVISRSSIDRPLFSIDCIVVPFLDRIGLHIIAQIMAQVRLVIS